MYSKWLKLLDQLECVLHSHFFDISVLYKKIYGKGTFYRNIMDRAWDKERKRKTWKLYWNVIIILFDALSNEICHNIFPTFSLIFNSPAGKYTT